MRRTLAQTPPHSLPLACAQINTRPLLEMPHPAKKGNPVERQDLKRTVRVGPNKSVTKKGAPPPRSVAPSRVRLTRLPPARFCADGHGTGGWGHVDDHTIGAAAMDRNDPNYDSADEAIVLEASA